MTTIEFGEATHQGHVRSLNEDSRYVGERLWFVADGMGGHAAGDVASAIAVEVVSQQDNDELDCGRLVTAIHDAHEAILDYGEENPDAAGLGTTISGVAQVTVNDTEHWAVFNVGDSRVYRWESGELRRATVDHSEVEELILAGQLTEAEGRVFPGRHVITRSLGSDEYPEVDLWMLPRTGGEVFILCSDGLSDEVDDDEIEQLIPDKTPQELAESLVAAALENGGHDNVTVIVVYDVGPSWSSLELTQPRRTLAVEED